MTDDGWCGQCETTTDGKCIHLEDGTTIPRPADEISRLAGLLREIRELTGQAVEVDFELELIDALHQVADLERRLENKNTKMKQLRESYKLAAGTADRRRLELDTINKREGGYVQTIAALRGQLDSITRELKAAGIQFVRPT
jgi:chromosome segregation ATPase